MEEEIIGIYQIRNLVSGKIYIGQSKNIYARWYEHKRELNKNEHHSRYLQRSWNKNGQDNFEFLIVEICDIEELNEKEIYWIEKNDSFKSGYNSNIGGCGSRGYIPTEETRKKISKSHKALNKKLTQEQKQKLFNAIHTNLKEILQFDLKGNFIKEWSCELEIVKDCNISSRGIGGCCRREKLRRTANGFIWIYKEDYEKDNDIINYYLDRKPTKSKKVRVIGTEDIFVSINDLARRSEEMFGVKFQTQNISQVCLGKRKSHKGYTFEYI